MSDSSPPKKAAETQNMLTSDARQSFSDKLILSLCSRMGSNYTERKWHRPMAFHLSIIVQYIAIINQDQIKKVLKEFVRFLRLDMAFQEVVEGVEARQSASIRELLKVWRKRRLVQTAGRSAFHKIKIASGDVQETGPPSTTDTLWQLCSDEPRFRDVLVEIRDSLSNSHPALYDALIRHINENEDVLDDTRKMIDGLVSAMALGTTDVPPSDDPLSQSSSIYDNPVGVAVSMDSTTSLPRPESTQDPHNASNDLRDHSHSATLPHFEPIQDPAITFNQSLSHVMDLQYSAPPSADDRDESKPPQDYLPSALEATGQELDDNPSFLQFSDSDGDLSIYHMRPANPVISDIAKASEGER